MPRYDAEIFKAKGCGPTVYIDSLELDPPSRYTVYIVTLYYDDKREPIVTVFSNEEAAKKMYEYHKGHLKEGVLAPDHVCMDEAPLYGEFKTNDEM